MPKSILDLTGHVYGRLTVLSFYHRFEKRTKWKCICECGKLCIVRGDSLRDGGIRSCGCLKKEMDIEKCYIHGGWRTLEYKPWNCMMNRCYNKNDTSYSDYGNRGIIVCESWHDFNNFYKDMHPRPSLEYSIERIDCNWHYEPENCTWATDAEQAKNTTRSRKFNINGEEINITDICKKYNLNYSIIYWWLKKGYSIEEIISGSYKNV